MKLGKKIIKCYFCHLISLSVGDSVRHVKSCPIARGPFLVFFDSTHGRRNLIGQMYTFDDIISMLVAFNVQTLGMRPFIVGVRRRRLVLGQLKYVWYTIDFIMSVCTHVQTNLRLHTAQHAFFRSFLVILPKVSLQSSAVFNATTHCPCYMDRVTKGWPSMSDVIMVSNYGAQCLG